jgi:hypothetical protein
MMAMRKKIFFVFNSRFRHICLIARLTNLYRTAVYDCSLSPKSVYDGLAS